MATKMDLAAAGAEHELFFFQTWDHDETYAKLVSGEPTGVLATIPTLVDATVAPPGEHLVTATILCPYRIVDLGGKRKSATWRWFWTRWSERFPATGTS